MKTWKLTIRRIVPSANVYMRLHFRKRMDLKDSWGYLLLAAGVRDIPKATKKRHVKITRHSLGTLDQLNSSLCHDKLICDELVKFQLLVDDSPKWVKIVEVNIPKADEPLTEIEITER